MASVVVAPAAFCAISLHATRHKNLTVHGLLIGSRVDSIVRVEQAIPICHGTPTVPLVEAALGLLLDQNIVGWYTAPVLLEDTTPSPVAMRIFSGLDTGSDTTEPVLVVVQNQGLANCLENSGAPPEGALTAFGKDSSKQWLKSLPLKVQDPNKATKATLEALQQNYTLDDFEDHLEGPVSAAFPDQGLANLVSKTRG